MSRQFFRVLAAVAGIACAGGCGSGPSSQRTIPYDSGKPIAARLLPGDRQVLVQMKTPEPDKADAGAAESFEQEIQRLRRGQIVALVRVTTARGDIADRGTWVRTTVNGEMVRLVNAPAGRALGESIEFSYPAGTAQIGDVVVTTGKFPRFVDGEQYLVFLITRPAGPSSLIWNGIAFRVDAAGVLRHVGLNEGGEQSFRTNLIGRSVSEVMDALSR